MTLNIKKYSFMPSLISAILIGIYHIGAESFIRFFGDHLLIMAVVINISGGIFLFLLIPNKKEIIKKMPGKDLLSLFVASFFAFGLAYLCLYKSIDLIGSIKVSFLIQIEAVFIIILAILFLKERFKLIEFFGLLVVLLGILLLNFANSLLSFSIGVGEIYTLLAALSFAIGIIIISKLVKKYSLTYLTSIEMIFGGIILSLFLIADPIAIKPLFILLLLPIGFILAMGWLTYNLGVKYVGAAKNAIIFSSQSFFTLVFSYFICNLIPSLGITIPSNIPFVLLGGAIIFGGIVILELSKTK
ncbi:MAG: DMT family transporter [Candidatus Pacebacteria bacterium]|nr:DMT family transporter [Candidatus Paceibacterota bacterium]